MLLSQNLIPCSLTFCSFNPYLLFKFLIFMTSGALKINLAISFITGMHWLGYNDAVPWLNKAKIRILNSAYSQF